MKKTLAASIVATAGIMATSAFAAPNPREVTIRNIVHNGSGCPLGSVGSDISPDAKAFTLSFGEYYVEQGPGIPRSESRKNCQVTLNLRVPQGWTYSIFKVDYRGFASLDRGTYGEQKSTYYFQGQSGRTNQVTLSSLIRGGYDNDYQINDDIAITNSVWSPCGANRALNINTSIRVGGSSRKSAYMTVDSIDGEMKHIYNIRWRRC